MNAELEGRIRLLQADIDQIVRERNQSETKNSSTNRENSDLKEQVRKLTTELEFYKKTHNVSLDKFESKFQDFQTELVGLTATNQQLKEREKNFKRQIRELEFEIIEWKEKAKHTKIAKEQTEFRLSAREQEVVRLAHDKEIESVQKTLLLESRQSKKDNTDRAFGELKALIGQYKKEREVSKENRRTHVNGSDRGFGSERRLSPNANLRHAVSE